MKCKLANSRAAEYLIRIMFAFVSHEHFVQLKAHNDTRHIQFKRLISRFMAGKLSTKINAKNLPFFPLALFKLSCVCFFNVLYLLHHFLVVFGCAESNTQFKCKRFAAFCAAVAYAASGRLLCISASDAEYSIARSHGFIGMLTSYICRANYTLTIPNTRFLSVREPRTLPNSILVT